MKAAYRLFILAAVCHVFHSVCCWATQKHALGEQVWQAIFDARVVCELLARACLVCTGGKVGGMTGTRGGESRAGAEGACL